MVGDTQQINDVVNQINIHEAGGYHSLGCAIHYNPHISCGIRLRLRRAYTNWSQKQHGIYSAVCTMYVVTITVLAWLEG